MTDLDLLVSRSEHHSFNVNLWWLKLINVLDTRALWRLKRWSVKCGIYKNQNYTRWERRQDYSSIGWSYRQKYFSPLRGLLVSIWLTLIKRQLLPQKSVFSKTIIDNCFTILNLLSISKKFNHTYLPIGYYVNSQVPRQKTSDQFTHHNQSKDYLKDAKTIYMYNWMWDMTITWFNIHVIIKQRQCFESDLRRITMITNTFL